MKHVEIDKIKETLNSDEANDMIESGWVLLSTGFIRGPEPGHDSHSYSLGLPKGTPDKTAENNKLTEKKTYNYGF